MKTKLYRFEVSGRGAFPVDMLRYDICYPSGCISAADLLGDHQRTISFDSTKEPTVLRWNSFNWSCEIMEEVR